MDYPKVSFENRYGVPMARPQLGQKTVSLQYAFFRFIVAIAVDLVYEVKTLPVLSGFLKYICKITNAVWNSTF